MSKPAKQVYEFGPFRIDAQKRLLLSGETAVPLTPKAFEMLLVLVESSPEVIEKDELLKRVWPHQIVEESNLTVNMSALRKALGEGPNEHRYIVTVPGRGYRFVADVTRPEDQSVDLILEEHTGSRVVITLSTTRISVPRAVASVLEDCLMGERSLPLAVLKLGV